MKKIIFVLIIGLLLMGLIFTTACSSINDPCQSQFDNCNHNCGEGILSSICKEKCTYDYNRCRENSK